MSARLTPHDRRLKEYEPPKLVELGSLHELTKDTKSGPHCDVSCFHASSVSASSH